MPLTEREKRALDNLQYSTRGDALINTEEDLRVFADKQGKKGGGKKQPGLADKLVRREGQGIHEGRPDLTTPSPRGGGVGGSGGGQSGIAGESTPGGTNAGGQPFYYDDADLKYWQKQFDYYRNQGELDKFQFDDTYAPDSAGFRDVGGYIGDIGKTVVGAIGASKKLDDYEPSSDFNTMMDESRNRRNLGLSQADRTQSASAMDRAYNYDVSNIRSMAGGSGGAALANLGGAANRYYGAQNQLTSLDQQLKQQNRQQFYQSAMAGEQVNQFGFQEKRGREMLSKQAAGNLMSSSMENIRQRKEYEDTYLNPDSPYYQYQKELTLDTRQNRELKTFQEEQRVKEIDQWNLDRQNEAQEKIEGIETGRKTAEEEYRNKLSENGLAPQIETAEDFNNYNGEPVVGGTTADGEFVSPEGKGNVGLANTISDIGENRNEVVEGFGYSRNEMGNMSDEELSEEGITRRVDEVESKNRKTGKMETTKVTNYGLAKPMDEEADVNAEMSTIEDDINQDYSQREKELMDEWYLKDEKEYNKRLAALREEKTMDLKNKVQYQDKQNKAFKGKDKTK